MLTASVNFDNLGGDHLGHRVITISEPELFEGAFVGFAQPRYVGFTERGLTQMAINRYSRLSPNPMLRFAKKIKNRASVEMSRFNGTLMPQFNPH